MPEEETITFEFIRKIHREEQREAKLTRIPEDFYEKARLYLEEKRKLAEKQKDKGASFEVRNVERLIEDIYNRRETKMIHLALITARTGIPPQNLLEVEKEFFESLVDMLRKQRERVLNILFKKTKVTEKEKKEGMVKVTFTEDIPEFIGADLKTYGPFKKGETAEIPRKNAELLIESGKAERS